MHANSIEINVKIRLNCSQTSCKTPQKMMQKPWQKEKKRKFAYNAIGSHLIWIKHRTILVKQISTRIGCVFFLCVVRVLSGIALLLLLLSVRVAVSFRFCDTLFLTVFLLVFGPRRRLAFENIDPKYVYVFFSFFLVSIWLKMTSRCQEITLYILVAALHLNKFDSIRFDSISCCVRVFFLPVVFFALNFPWSV